VKIFSLLHFVLIFESIFWIFIRLKLFSIKIRMKSRFRKVLEKFWCIFYCLMHHSNFWCFSNWQ
jgi:hypothetical protein